MAPGDGDVLPGMELDLIVPARVNNLLQLTYQGQTPYPQDPSGQVNL